MRPNRDPFGSTKKTCIIPLSEHGDGVKSTIALKFANLSEKITDIHAIKSLGLCRNNVFLSSK